MKKNFILIIESIAFTCLFVFICELGARFLCISCEKELTETNLHNAALVVVTVEILIVTFAVCIYAGWDTFRTKK